MQTSLIINWINEEASNWHGSYVTRNHEKIHGKRNLKCYAGVSI